MKRILSLLLAGGVALGAATGAAAVDFKASGSYQFAFEYVDHHRNMYWDRAVGSDGEKHFGEDKFEALQQVNLRLEAIANERLRGVYQARIGYQSVWGMQNDNGFAGGRHGGFGIGSQGVNVMTYEAFLDWKPVPQADVRMGLQEVIMPYAVAGTICYYPMAGINATYAFNNQVSANLFWYRPTNSANGVITDNDNRSSKWDILGMALPLTFDGVSFTPWGIYSMMGKGAYNTWESDFTAPGWITGDMERAGTGIRPWWIGLAAEVSILDPVIFKMDFMYSGAKGHGSWNPGTREAWEAAGFGSDYSRRGWLLIAQLQYKMENMTPSIIGWYASGDKIENGRRKLRRLAGIAPSWWTSSFGFDGSFNCTSKSCAMGPGPMGTWAIGALLEDIHSFENLSHTLRLYYYRGTNDYKKGMNFGGAYMPDPELNPNGTLKPYGGLYLTKKDWAMEVNVDTFYNIMENLTCALELGYIYANLKESGIPAYDNAVSRNTYKFGMYVTYSF